MKSYISKIVIGLIVVIIAFGILICYKNISDKEIDSTGNKAYFAAKASYNVSDAITFNMVGGIKLFKNDDIDPKWGIGAGVDYVVMDGLTVNADIRYMSETKTNGNGSEDDSLSFLVAAAKTIGSNASLGVGFEGATNGGGFATFDAAKNDAFTWCVPVMFNLSF